MSTEIAEGGYCFDCRIAFTGEQDADCHYNLTGHQVGWPMEAVDWPEATPEQIAPIHREAGP